MTSGTSGTGGPPAGMRTNTERAEERLDRIGDQLKRFFSDGAKPFVLKTVGRIREEAEDIVAEAKNVRGRSPSDAPPA